MTSVVIAGWSPDFRKVPFTKLLRGDAGLSLPAAKKITDRVLSGERIIVLLPSAATAEAFRSCATGLGAVVETDETDSPPPRQSD